MANVDSAHGFIVEGSFVPGAGIPFWKGRVKAGQTFTIGDPVRFSSGQLRICTAADIVAGVAAEACASLTEGTEVLFVPALPHIFFSAQTSGDYSNGLLFALVDMEGTTGIFEVNEDANTNKTLRIIGRKDVGNTSSGNWCEVLVTFAESQWGTHYTTAGVQ
jgi:hypothetical protein